MQIAYELRSNFQHGAYKAFYLNAYSFSSQRAALSKLISETQNV